jgi:pimeloyl-ACP methyl ester carboxylesterase
MIGICGHVSTLIKDRVLGLSEHSRKLISCSVVLFAITALSGYAQSAWAIDTGITIASPADITLKQATLINQVWGTNSLPATQPQVTIGIANPFLGFTNLARVDQYTASMSNGQSNTSNLYLAANSNGRLVILNPGHQGTCNWTAFPTIYGVRPALQALLNAGYSVLAMNMPNCGSTASHNLLFATYGNAAMRYFIEPAIQAMNYWDTHGSFTNYNFVGFSGGGWTAVVLAALDARIKISVQIAGSMPGVHFVGASSPNHGDAEQTWSPFYSVASYEDLYLMGSNGAGRKQLQILIANDSKGPCCFSSPEWYGTVSSGFNYAAYFGERWDQYLDLYFANILTTQASVGSDFSLVQDYVATAHQISSFAIDMAIGTLDNVGTKPVS